MASSMWSSSCFGRLPDNVLQMIETSLNVKDRLAFFSCCRAVRAYQKAATGGLWPELKFKLRNMEQTEALAAWLARNREHLWRLQFTAGSLKLSVELAHTNRAALSWLAAEAAQCIMAVLCVLAGSSVHTLSVDVADAYADLNVGSWVLCLPQLESLHIKAGRLTISADLSHLTRLTSLTLTEVVYAFPGSGPIKLPTPGMPPRLRELELWQFDAGSFHACVMGVGALPQLQRLLLESPSADWASVLPWDWLPLRTALTMLTLVDWGGMEALPEQLAALTGLRELGSVKCRLAATDEAVAPLSALTGLTNLGVVDGGWRSIPASVFALPSLKELDVKYFCDTDSVVGVFEPAVPLAGSSSITRLHLSAEMALGAAQQLVRFPALHALYLRSDEYLFEGDEQHEAVGRLLGELKKLPKFAELDVGCVEHPAFRRFVRFLRVLNLEYPFKITTSKFANLLEPIITYESDLDIQDWSDIE